VREEVAFLARLAAQRPAVPFLDRREPGEIEDGRQHVYEADVDFGISRRIESRSANDHQDPVQLVEQAEAVRHPAPLHQLLAVVAQPISP